MRRWKRTGPAGAAETSGWAAVPDSRGSWRVPAMALQLWLETELALALWL